MYKRQAQGGICNAAIPVSMRFDQNTNPTGVRCDVYDHMVNIFGRDPVTGYARRPLDNVGVQYGLAALNSGAISKQQFLDLNQNIGGYDNNGNNIAGRTVGAAFVGAAASALVLAEELRALHDGPRFEVVSWSLRSPEHIEAVVNPAPGPNTNPGYVTAA